MRRIIIAAFLFIPCLGFNQTWNGIGNGIVNGGVTGFFSGEKLWIGSAGSANYSFCGVPMRGLCSFDGAQIDTMESGLCGSANDVAWYNGRLVVGGMFAYVGVPPFGVPFTKDIASYDTFSGTWMSLTPSAGINSAVKCMEVYNGELFVAGQMTSVNGVACNRIAKWNGSAWSNVSGGVNGSIEAIYSTAIYHGQLYVGGLFTNAGLNNIPTYGIARWNGTQWDSVGGGLNGGVYAMVVDSVNDVLYVGGGFTMAGGVVAFGVAEWNDTAWSAVGPGTDTLCGTKCLAVFNGQLYAGGGNETVTAAGDTIKNIYTYDGVKWTSVDGGSPGTVLNLCVYHGNLYVGGLFNSIGYGVPANNIACYGITCPTSVGVLEQPPPVPFVMYPNPNDEVLHISTEDPSELIFRLYNSAGQLVDEENFRRQLDYSTKELSSGTYSMQVSLRDGSRLHTEPLIVK